MQFLLRLFGRCPQCKTWHRPWAIKARRMNTCYRDDRRNWTVSCPACYDAIQAYWADCWKAYYAEVL